MKKLVVVLAALFCVATVVRAELLPAEKLLPNDTLFVLSTPDSSKLSTAFGQSAQGRYWSDPAMKRFREDFLKKLSEDLAAPLEKSLGFKLGDFKGLAQGQFSFAITQNGYEGKTNQSVGLILLIDCKDKSDKLKTALTDLKKKWQETGREIKAEKIRDTDFTTVVTTDEIVFQTLNKLFPSPPEEGQNPQPPRKPARTELTIGQFESMLLVANSPAMIEKVLARQAGGIVTVLAENPSFEGNYNAVLRNAQLYAWANIKAVSDIMGKAEALSEKPFLGMTLEALSSGGLKTLAWTYQELNEGSALKIFLGAPAGDRQGMMKVLFPEAKDSAPPSFVPADAVKFSRMRLDVRKAFTAFESAYPTVSGVLKFLLDTGKAQDPTFDFRKGFVENLGDDLITYEKAPRGTSFEEMDSAPSLFLISSPDAPRLAHSLKVAFGGLDPDSTKEREFLGRKLYSSAGFFGLLGLLQVSAAAPPNKALHFAASGGYVAFSTDVSMVEEYLRSGESKPKPLAETAGLAEAAQKVGGTGTGMFAYENRAQVMRFEHEIQRKQGLAGSAAPAEPAKVGLPLGDATTVKEWSDYALLPPYDQVAKYFHSKIYSGTADASGFTVNLFYPTPPELKK